MNIAINLLQLAPGRTEGVTTYVRELLTNMTDYIHKDNVYILVQHGLELPDFQSNSIEIISIKKEDSRGLRKKLSFKYLKNKLQRNKNYNLSELILQKDIQLIHYPFSIIPELDQKINIPIILSIMDLQHEYYPSLFTKRDLIERKKNFYSSAHRADHIIAISDYTRKSIVKKLGVPEDKVEVIYLAGNLSKNIDTSIILPKKFMYYPAGDWLHKNHRNLFKAMAYLRNEGNFVPKLVLTGIESQSKAINQELIDELGISSMVKHLGQVSYEQVAGIYSRANMLIYPSLFEGFGIPLLEAMTAGIPIACSNRTSIPEVAANSACYFNPDDPESIARSIKKVWFNKDYRRKLITRGNAQVKNFSWQTCALSTYNVYKKVLKGDND